MLNLALDVWSERPDTGFAPGVPVPALNLDLTNPATASLLTTVRGSVGYADDSSGNWTQFAANTPRITDKGLLVEEVRTNSIRNNSMQGAVAGSPGVLPTNWTISGGSGLTRTIGVGTENGMDYLDMRFQGVAADTFVTGYIDGASVIPAVEGQVWAASFFHRLAAGSMANITSFQVLLTQTGGAGTTNTFPTLTPAWQRYSAIRTMPVSTTFVWQRWAFNYTIGAVIDVTLRLAWPQLELGAFVTSPIRTTSVAVARQGEVISVLSIPAGMTALTIFGDGVPLCPVAIAANQSKVQTDNGGNNERANAYRAIPAGASAAVFAVAGVGDNLSGAVWPENAYGKIAVGYSSGVRKLAFNGVLSSGAPAGAPASPIALRLGNNSASAGGAQLIQRAALWSSLLTDDQLRVITGGSLVPPPVLDLILTNPGNDAALTTARASNAWADNEAGVWSMFAPNVARLTDKGLLVEEARTNSIQNNSATGAVAGTPGTLPNLWGSPAVSPGTQHQILGVGTEKGIDYIDFRFWGTPTGDPPYSYEIDFSSLIPATPGQIYAFSVFAALKAGSLNNVLWGLGVSALNSGGAWISNTADIPLANLNSSFIRHVAPAIANPALTANLLGNLYFEMTGPYDFTIRMGWPQLELGAFVTSPIRTTAGAVARAADAVRAANIAWYNAAAGTLYVEGVSPVSPAASFQTLASIDDDTSNERFTIRAAAGPINGIVVDGGVSQASINVGTLAPDVPVKAALAYALNDIAFTVNGAAVGVDITATLPTPTMLAIGGRMSVGGDPLRGWVRRVAYWNVRMPDAFLRAFTA